MDELAIDQRLAAHEAEHEVGTGLRLGDQAVDRWRGDIERHHARRAAELALVGVAVAAAMLQRAGDRLVGAGDEAALDRRRRAGRQVVDAAAVDDQEVGAGGAAEDAHLSGE